MLLGWFSARQAAEVGSALADQFAPPTVPGSSTRRKKKSARGERDAALQKLLRRAERETSALRLNLFKKATFANSFKWRLLENGVEREMADEVTRTLVLHISQNQADSAPSRDSAAAPADRPNSSTAQYLLTQGNEYLAQGAYAKAITSYEQLLKLNPRHADALNNLGAAVCKLGRYQEAEQHFRRAIGVRPDYSDAHSNLGTVLRGRGHLAGSENSLRRALKLKPNHVDARSNLGLTLLSLGRPIDAKAHFERALRIAPGHANALLGMGQVARMQGRFDEAEAILKRVLEADPNMPAAWAASAGLRKMTPDGAWLQRAEDIAASGIAPLEEAGLRFAIGKYFDDVADFKRAFHSYKRANDLMKTVLAEKYQPDVHTQFVDDLIRVYTRETISRTESGGSASVKPIFVVGMMRSGTSLVEQIVASHRAVRGAGELQFWSDAVRQHATAIRQGSLGEPLRKKLAQEYLRTVTGHAVDALRIVDKAPVNSDYLGVIHSVFPKARIIYMRRDPIDTCLSCYFQQFSPALSFTMDLSDLAHYYRQHQRLIAHWRTVLPAGAILDVPYEELIADQEGWTRKILEFLDLEWDERCLDFQSTQRTVATASYWQVRQRIYGDSVQRWRNYKRFIGALRDLKDLVP
jgi:tetratricopeptide (TPR) repeat protein